MSRRVAQSSFCTPASWAARGIVSKRRDAPYRSGMVWTWIRSKARRARLRCRASSVHSRLRALRVRRLLPRRIPELHQLVERDVENDTAAGAAGRIKDDLVGAAQHALHRFEIEALTRDLGRFAIFIVDFAESSGLAFRLGDCLLAIGLGRLSDLRRAAACLGNDAVGVGRWRLIRTARRTFHESPLNLAGPVGNNRPRTYIHCTRESVRVGRRFKHRKSHVLPMDQY